MDAQETESEADVPLTWLDFLYAFKEMQYKKTKEVSRERDWFKLNPLDIFVYGCETVGNNDAVRRKMNNIEISMENLFPTLKDQPRLLVQIFDLLFRLIMAESDTKTFLCKRLLSLLSDILKRIKTCFRLSLWLLPWLSQKLLMSNTKERMEHLTIGEEMTRLKENSMSDDDVSNLRNLFCLNEEHSILLYLLKSEYSCDVILALMKKVFLKESFLQFSPKCVEKYLQLLEITLYVSLEHNVLKDSFDERSSDQASEKLVNRSDCNAEEDISKIKIIESYFSWLNSLLQQCKEKVGSSSVQESLLSYFLLELTNRLSTSSELETLYDHEALDVIVVSFFNYVEGFLDADRERVMLNLLEFVSSGIEMKQPRDTMLGVYLPNLLSVGFGYGNAYVICLLLEYGTCSLYSKHKKDLFSDSLSFILSVCKLFPTADEVRKENEYISQRVESVKVATELIDDLLLSLVVPATESSSGNLSKDGDIDQAPCLVEDIGTLFNDVDKEKNFKVCLLQRLLKLACHMVKATENINYSFANLLPKLFYRQDFPPVPSNLPTKFFPAWITKHSNMDWKVSKHDVAMDILNLCVKCYEGGVTTTFQICGIMVPKLVENLNMTGLSDHAKMRILQKFLKFCYQKVKTSEHINSLITHGLDLISHLMPNENLTEQTTEVFIQQVASSIEKLGHTSSLLFMKTSCNFLLQKLPHERTGISKCFLNLIKKCNRNDIRNVFLISRPWLLQDRFAEIRRYVYTYSSGVLKSKQLQALTEVLTALTSVEENLRKEFPELSCPSVDEDIHLAIRDGFKSQRHTQILRKLHRLPVYYVLMPDSLSRYLEDKESGDQDNWMEAVESEFPSDILENDGMMILLQTITRRIEQMQIPRYQSLKTFLIELLKVFISQSTGMNSLKSRISAFHTHISNLDWNTSKKEHLVKLGYGRALWSDDNFELEVKTTGTLNLEENLRQTLLSCYREYCEILSSLNIATIMVDGAAVKLDDVFSDELALSELKGRRSIVLKLIDNYTNQTHMDILEKKSSLLMKEEQIENDLYKMAAQPLSPQTFIVKLNRTFFECANCCGAQIVGCYSPQAGEHCERPLEIGFRADSAFASIYHKDTEIENCELLFTDEGVYCFKSYTNAHPYDTSEVWMQFYIELLDNRDYVPALILPHFFPNRSTWESIRRWVSPDVVNTFISCDYDFSTEWRTYYDYRPETVGAGKDIILTKGFMSRERRTSFSFQRQVSVNVNKDLAGELSDHAMQKLLQDENLKCFRFLGKQFLLILNNFTESGRWDTSDLEKNFNADRWKKGLKESDRFFNMQKEDIIRMLSAFLWDCVAEYLMNMNVKLTLQKKTRQFHQTRTLLQKLSTSIPSFPFTKKMLREIRLELKSHLRILHISDLSVGFQEELMHWIFENEDRVWRYRGGRENETLSQFLHFLPHKRQETKCFPGVIVYLQKNNEPIGEHIAISNMVGYAIGEYINDEAEHQEIVSGKHSGDVYEIVTAWINPNYRRLQLSTDVYLEIIGTVSSRYVTFDLLTQHIERVIRSSSFLMVLKKCIGEKHLVVHRSQSYSVQTENGLELFEKVTLNRPPIAVAMGILEYSRVYRYYFVGFCFLVFAFCIRVVLSIF